VLGMPNLDPFYINDGICFSHIPPFSLGNLN